ncbi:hypothetical protein WA158_000811 [Blastocystis sp. Blastoise]
MSQSQEDQRIVADWLNQIGLEYLAPKLFESGIVSGVQLAALNESDIRKLNVNDIEKLKLINFIKILKHTRNHVYRATPTTVKPKNNAMNTNSSSFTHFQFPRDSLSINEEDEWISGNDMQDSLDMHYIPQIKRPETKHDRRTVSVTNRRIESLGPPSRRGRPSGSQSSLSNNNTFNNNFNLQTNNIPISTNNITTPSFSFDSPNNYTTTNSVSTVESTELLMKKRKLNKVITICRKRRKTAVERRRGDIEGITILNDHELRLLRQKEDGNSFPFRYIYDHSYNEDINNEIIYSQNIQPYLSDCIETSTPLITMVYGTVGSGRRYTLFGAPSQLGVCELTARDLLSQYCNTTMNNNNNNNSSYMYNNYSLEVSFLELKNGSIYDLLDMRNRVLLNDSKDINAIYRNIKSKPMHSLPSIHHLLMNGLEISSCSKEMNSFQIVIYTLKDFNKRIKTRFAFILIPAINSMSAPNQPPLAVKKQSVEPFRTLDSLSQYIKGSISYTSSTPIPREYKLLFILKPLLVNNPLYIYIIPVHPCEEYIELYIDICNYMTLFKPQDLDMVNELSTISEDNREMSMEIDSSPKKSFSDNNMNNSLNISSLSDNISIYIIKDCVNSLVSFRNKYIDEDTVNLDHPSIQKLREGVTQLKDIIQTL